jgi:alkylation response protein AidB-like acyl-CoA dehydrogenase
VNAPDLLYSQIEEDLRDTVRKVLRDRCGWPAVLARCEQEQPYDLDLWRTLAAELGLTGLPIPEDYGGAGAGVRELAVLAEETGRAIAPIPLLGSVLATAALLECADSPGVPDVLRGIADGSRIVTCAVPMTTAPGDGFPGSVRSEDSHLTGSIRAVVDLHVADLVVIPASDADGPALYLLDTSVTGVRRTAAIPLDLTRRFGVLELNRAPATRIRSADAAAQALQHSLLTAAGVLAGEQVGLAQLCLDSTVDYAMTRHQFGRPIGSFQAVKHRLADLWAGVSTARAAARNAADRLSRFDDEARLAVATAQAYCSDLVVLAAEDSLQLHGGIGMTWEHPAHLALGRAKSTQLTFGIPERHRTTISELVGLPFP